MVRPTVLAAPKTAVSDRPAPECPPPSDPSMISEAVPRRNEVAAEALVAAKDFWSFGEIFWTIFGLFLASAIIFVHDFQFHVC